MILVTWEEAKGIATRTAQLLRLDQHPLIACFLGCATVVYMAGYRGQRRATPVLGACAVVTGGSSGVGRATAEALAARGARLVFILARSRNALEQAAVGVREMAREGRPCTVVCIPIDASDGPAIAAAFRDTIVPMNDGRAPTIVVNCAGAGVWRFLHEATPAELDTAVDAPYRAALHVSAAAARAVADDIKNGRAAESHTIVQVQSPGGHTVFPGAAAYLSARWALHGLHLALVADYGATARPALHAVECVLGEVTDSAYFASNPGSHARIPWTGRLAGRLTSRGAGLAVVDSIGRGTGSYGYPYPLAVTLALNGTGWAVRRALELANGATGARLTGF